MNIRPFKDALHAKYPGFWHTDYDSVSGGGRTVQLSQLFRGETPVKQVAGASALKGDRLVEVQLSDDGKHRTAHMMVTADGPIMGNPSNPKHSPQPLRMRATTYPIYFADPAGMLAAISEELARSDHKP